MSTKADDTKGKADDADKTSSSSTATKTIQEGSIAMHYPADQESTVFYNPVQVQNRDLSILMISLYAERRAVQMAKRRYQQSLSSNTNQYAKEAEQKTSEPNDGGKEKEKTGEDGAHNNSTVVNGSSDAPVAEKRSHGNSASSVQEKVAAFEQSLNPSKALHDLYETDSANGLCILDALAASGLRSLRYWKEIPGVHHVTINDLDEAAVERAHTNLQANQLQSVHIAAEAAAASGNTHELWLEKKSLRRPRGIAIQTGDATVEMYQSRPKTKLRPGFVATDHSWDVIDLDPYGSAAPFLDAAVQALTNGGLLCCTCTDMAALGGSRPEVCVGRYGSMPLQRAPYLQEMALRILLQSLAVTAAKYGRSIRPLLSVGLDFYVRVFVTVHDDKAAVNDLSRQLGHVYQSTQCQSFQVVPMGQMGGKKKNVYQAGRAPGSCRESGAPYKVGGPIWIGPLHDADLIQTALDRLSQFKKNPTTTTTTTTTTAGLSMLQHLATRDRLHGLLLSCRDELANVPLFYRLPEMAKTLHVSTPPLQLVRNALHNAGYRMSAYHKDPQALKTDAPDVVVWDVMRAYRQQQAENDKSAVKPPKTGSVEERILSRPMETAIDFSRPKQQQAANNQKTAMDEDAVARYPLNPPNWGPKKAATGYKRKAEHQQPTPDDTKPGAADEKTS